jgi:hypothetical protein
LPREWKEQCSFRSDPVAAISGTYANLGVDAPSQFTPLLWQEITTAPSRSSDASCQVKIEPGRPGHLKLSLVKYGRVSSTKEVEYTVKNNHMRLKRQHFVRSGYVILNDMGHLDVRMGRSPRGLQVQRALSDVLFIFVVPTDVANTGLHRPHESYLFRPLS